MALDFEAPADVDGNNIYEVEVVVTGGELTDTQVLLITITDVEEITPPFIERQPLDVGVLPGVTPSQHRSRW